MNNGKAAAIFKDIENPRFTNDEKRIAIRTVLNFETFNSITKQDFKNALLWLINFSDACDNMKKILFLCDRKKCGENHDCGYCRHTSDIKHAVNFCCESNNINDGFYFEKETGGNE